MNILGAIVAGIVATIVMTLVMMMAPQMGMPKMDIVGMLGSMFSRDSNRPLGMAMHLMRVSVYLTKAGADFTPVPAHQLSILRRMQIPVAQASAIDTAVAPDLIVDGLIGYSLKGVPRGAAADLIRWANGQNAPILALDAPSGVDTTTGVVFDPAIKATATMTLALPKAGLRAPGVAAQVGELFLADISVPPELYAAPGLNLTVGHLFAQSDIVRLR